MKHHTNPSLHLDINITHMLKKDNIETIFRTLTNEKKY